MRAGIFGFIIATEKKQLRSITMVEQRKYNNLCTRRDRMSSMERGRWLRAFSSLLMALVIAIGSATVLVAQVPFTANNPLGAPSYSGSFLYGTNMGWYGSTWNDEAIADIAAGNVQKQVPGVGARTLRPSMFEEFLETWGYDVRLQTFAHYASLGIQDNTVFLGLPASAPHRDNQYYGGCNQPSQLFKNMYEPIWDGGLNGTPVNDQNYYALYVYKTVTRYKNYVKFWEIVNEPDLDGSGNGWKSRGMPGNWWESNPAPCDLVNMHAPVQHYIRLLRISYEVIKSIDPTAYVTTGGIGYASFLDAILRNTDNPVDGTISAAYPHKGGAWFDGLSFHSYPMYSLQYWNNQIGAMAYRRHSDAALDAYTGVKREMDSVLALYQYNGNVYPKKTFICTENNIPRRPFNNLVGGDEVQKNYMIKALVGSQMQGIRQYYTYGIAESVAAQDAWDSFQLMGLYQTITGIGPLGNGGQYLQQFTPAGIAFKTTATLLRGAVYDEARTQQLLLPAGVRGAAFLLGNGNYMYAIWATTHTDLSEQSSAVYSFPDALITASTFRAFAWDYSQTQTIQTLSPKNMMLGGSPIFLTPNQSVLALPAAGNTPTLPAHLKQMQVYPQPADHQVTIRWEQTKPATWYWELFNLQGQKMQQSASTILLAKGIQQQTLHSLGRLPAGAYSLRMRFGQQWVTKPLLIRHP
jgi:hypothetical protein